MTVLDALVNRKCVREFTNDSIDDSVLSQLLEAVRWTPSSKNTQPWKIVVISGQKKIDLMEKISQACDNREKPRMEYDYDGDLLDDTLHQRAVDCGKALYGALDIARDDKLARIEQWKKNYVSFNSPTAIFIFKYNDIGLSSYMDCGMLIQSIILAATSLGLATCPQASLAHYPDIVKAELGYENYTLLCGIAIGYENVDAKINQYRTDRENVLDIAVIKS